MFLKLYTTHSTLHAVPYTLYATHSTLHTIRYTLYAKHRYTQHATHYTLHTVHYTLYATHCTLYTIRSLLKVQCPLLCSGVAGKGGTKRLPFTSIYSLNQSQRYPPAGRSGRLQSAAARLNLWPISRAGFTGLISWLGFMGDF